MKKKNKLLVTFLAFTLTLSMLLCSCTGTVFTEQESPNGTNSGLASESQSESATIGGSESSTLDTPATGIPATDVSGSDLPSTGEPSTGAPSTGEPSTDAPSTGAPSTGAPSTDAPATDTPNAATPIVSVNGVESTWSFDEGISEVFTAKAANKIDVKIPVTKAGSYSLGFKTNLGITRTFASGNKKATLSLPKTVFTEGEPIPVYYSTSGLDENSLKKPWIGITKDIEGKDKYIAWEYVRKNSEGVLDATLMTGARQEDNLLQYVVFPAGEYKIYFIDENALLSDRNNWLHSEPIFVTVLPKGFTNTKVTRSGTIHGNTTISTSNNLFCAGSQINVSYTATNLFANFSTKPWIAMAKWLPEHRSGSGQSEIYYTEGYYYHHWQYIEKTGSGTVSFTPSNASAQTYATSYKSLPEGSYAIHCITGSPIDNISWCTSATDYIGINLAPQYTIKANVGSASILNTTDTYGTNTTKKDITVTDTDVANGYVTVRFTFGSLDLGVPYYFNLQDVKFTAN